MALVARPAASMLSQNDQLAIDLTPVPVVSAGSGEVVNAAFRQENVIGSLLAYQPTGGGEDDPNFSPWDAIKGTDYEQYWDSFTDARNSGQAEAIKRQLDMELQDRRTIAAAGGWGMLATIGAGLLSPENLAPAGAIVRGTKLGSTVLKTALTTSSYAALSTAVAESQLQSTQELRTPQESAFNIGGAAVFGGLLGAGAAAIFTRADFARLGKALEADAKALDGVDLPANERAVLASDAGAAARPVETLDENTIAGRAAQVAGGAVAGLNPVLRVLHSPSSAVRSVGTRLFENPVYLKKNFEGVASAPSAETLVKEFTRGALASALDDSNKIYREYRKAAGTLGREQFNQAVGKAMRRGDAGEDPAISNAAKSWRERVFDPLKQKAIEAGLLPADVSVDTALSYFTRVYNKPRMIAREGEFKGIVRAYLGDEIRRLEFRKDEIKIGNQIVDADRKAEDYTRAFDRLTNIEDRLAGRAAVRRNKLDALREKQSLRFDVQKDRAPAALVRALRDKDQNANMLATLREARAAEKAAGRKQKYFEKYPILAMVKRSGGVKVGTPLDYELRSMGVTPQSHPGLFHDGKGRGALDNIVWGEEEVIFDNLAPLPDGYVDERALMEAIRTEVAGSPLRTKAQEAVDQDADNLASWVADWLDAAGLPSNITVGEARAFIKRVNGAEKAVDDLDTQIARMERDLDAFDEATDAVQNERLISQQEAATISAELDKLDEQILEVKQVADASPAVKLIVDYAQVRRDLGRARVKERVLNRRVDALKALRDAGRANDEMLAELAANVTDLNRLVDRIGTLAAKADKLKPMVPKMRQELPEFLNDADRQSYVAGIADDIFNTITGKNADGIVPRDIVAATRGPLKERTFHIPDHLIEDFLESDVEAVGRRYARTMAADIELKNAFGSADMKDALKSIRDDYAALRGKIDEDPADGSAPLTTEQRETLRKKLDARERADVRDIEALRDLLRGTYLAKENSTNYARVARVAGTINYLRLMGGVTLSSAADAARHVMVHGFGGVMRDGLVPLIANVKGFKLAVEEAKRAGAVTERLLNTRMATWADINDPYAVGSPFERFMENTANGFSRLNGLVYWNDFHKAFASVTTQNRVIRNAIHFDRLKPREAAYMAYLGIDGAMAERIAKQFDKFGTTEDGGVRVAHTDDWEDEWAKRTYRAAINKDVDSTIITKGVGDIPLFMNTPTGRLLTQFKSFAIASHQRALMRGLQERPMGFLSGALTATTIGMLIYYLKSLEANRQADVSDNPGRWIAEGLDRSGLFAIAFEANNTVEKAFGIGAYGALAALFPDKDQSGKASKYLNRSPASTILGPTGDMIDTMVRAGNAIKGSGDGWTEGDLNSVKRLLPGITLPGIRSLVEYAGMPAVRGGIGID